MDDAGATDPLAELPDRNGLPPTERDRPGIRPWTTACAGFSPRPHPKLDGMML